MFCIGLYTFDTEKEAIAYAIERLREGWYPNKIYIVRPDGRTYVAKVERIDNERPRCGFRVTRACLCGCGRLHSFSTHIAPEEVIQA